MRGKRFRIWAIVGPYLCQIDQLSLYGATKRTYRIFAYICGSSVLGFDLFKFYHGAPFTNLSVF